MQFEKKLSLASLLVVVSSQLGCAASLPKMQADRPIEIDHGFLGAVYKQNGEVIDPSDMKDQVARDPRAASDVSKARTLTFIATALGAVGGALIGWPVGQKLGGEEHPTWALAYAGAGAVVLSIPVAVWANSSLNSAVETFNQHLPRPVDASTASK